MYFRAINERNLRSLDEGAMLCYHTDTTVSCALCSCPLRLLEALLLIAQSHHTYVWFAARATVMRTVLAG